MESPTYSQDASELVNKSIQKPHEYTEMLSYITLYSDGIGSLTLFSGLLSEKRYSYLVKIIDLSSYDKQFPNEQKHCNFMAFSCLHF